MPPVRSSNVTIRYAQVALALLPVVADAAGATAEDIPPQVGRFLARVRFTIAPLTRGADGATIQIRDPKAIRSAALATARSDSEQRMLRVLSWLGAVPSRPGRGVPELPEPRDRAAWIDGSNGNVWLALADGDVAAADEPEAFVAIATADLRALSPTPERADARRCREAVARAVAERACWRSLAYFESGVLPDGDPRAVFRERGVVLGDSVPFDDARTREPWFRIADEFTSTAARAFVDRAVGFSGENGLSVVLRNPPTSSEQLLYPEKYFDPAQHDDPTPVVAIDLIPELGSEWSLYVDTELGEYFSGALLRATGDPLRALKAARGFDGDAFRVYEHEPTHGLLLHWTIVLDGNPSAATVRDRSLDAIEFIDSLRKTLERRYAGSNPRVETHLDDDGVSLNAIEKDGGRAHAFAYRFQDRVEFLLCDEVALDLETLLADRP